MKKKEKFVGFRLSEKNVVYLQEMGFLTPGRAKAAQAKKLSVNQNAPNLSEFLNQIITHTLETENHGFAAIVPRQALALAYWKHQTLAVSRDYEELHRKMDFARAQLAKADDELIAYERGLAERGIVYRD